MQKPNITLKIPKIKPRQYERILYPINKLTGHYSLIHKATEISSSSCTIKLLRSLSVYLHSSMHIEFSLSTCNYCNLSVAFNFFLNDSLVCYFLTLYVFFPLITIWKMRYLEVTKKIHGRQQLQQQTED